MKPKIYYLPSILFAILTSCSPAFYYKPNPATTNAKDIFISNGIIYAISQQPFTTVYLSAVKPAQGELELMVSYTNNNLDRVDAVPDLIRVFAHDEDDTINLKQIHTYSADQYIRKLQRRQNFTLAMQAGIDGYNNAQAAYSKSTNTTSSVSPNGTYIIKTTTTTAYDPIKLATANAISRQQLQQSADQFSKYDQSVSENLIRGNTLFRGQTVKGYVVINTGNSFDEKIWVEVPFGNELHTFILIPNR